MKNRFKLTILVLALVAISCACQREDENHHRTIRFMNKSDMLLYIDSSNSYPDTLFKWSGEALVFSNGDRFKAYPDTENRSAFFFDSRDFYEDMFRNERWLPSDTLIVFVFDGKQLESNPADANKSIIQYYYLSLADLKYLNWTLTYPPTPEMSVVKMYPPYKQTEQ